VAAEWLMRRDAEKRLCQVQWDEESGKAEASPWRTDDRAAQRGDADEPELKKQKKT